MGIHIYGKHGAAIPGKEGLEFHVIVWNLTRQFSGQIQTVDIRGLIIVVSLIEIFKYIKNMYNYEAWNYVILVYALL